MVTHEGRIVAVRDNHGYDIGKTATCTCGWESGELRDSPGLALLDQLHHLNATSKETPA